MVDKLGKMKVQNEVMTWRKFDTACRKIANWAKFYSFTGVYGIPKGGLVLAVKLAYLLDIPLITDEKHVRVSILFVDDIQDSGCTRSCLIPVWNKFATLYCNKLQCSINKIALPDFWVYEKKDRWITFPWEV